MMDRQTMMDNPNPVNPVLTDYFARQNLAGKKTKQK